jgi:hypothetical protein
MTDMAAGKGETPPDAQREDLELEEGWRAAAAAGFDTEMTLDGDVLRCAGCGRTSRVTEASFLGAIFVRDTPTARDGLAVHELRCPRCDRPARFVASATLLADVADRAPTVAVRSETDAHHRTDRTSDEPLGDDRKFFDDGGPGNLRDGEDLLDAEGDDIRMYTGEPVETEDGWILPRQQNVGPGNMAGDGEFPDPNTPPAQEPPAR